MLRLVLVFVLVVGCRSEHRPPDRPPAKPGSGIAGSAEPVPVPVPTPTPTPAATEPAGPPPGTDELVVVPADIGAQVKLVKIGDLKRPVDLVVAPGDARKRLFVLEQHRGTIRVIENGQIAKQPFLKIGNLADGSEQGLLGLAFHPKFAENKKLYVNYTSSDNNTHIVEYTATDADAADPKSARELANILQPYSNHNGGDLMFGPDGKLWIGLGDGGAANDPHRNGQDPDALLGKMLRLDVDTPGAKPQIHYLGLRNPWRYWFDAKTHDLYIADVGQNMWEEVDVVNAADLEKPLNFGWNVVEGNHCFQADECDKTKFVAPVVEYKHDQGCSITGGVTYRGKALPALDGRYFYADHCTGILRSFLWTRGFVREHWDWKATIDKEAVLSQVTSFGVDHDGEIYIMTLTGGIYELVSSSSR